MNGKYGSNNYNKNLREIVETRKIIFSMTKCCNFQVNSTNSNRHEKTKDKTKTHVHKVKIALWSQERRKKNSQNSSKTAIISNKTKSYKKKSNSLQFNRNNQRNRMSANGITQKIRKWIKKNQFVIFGCRVPT